MSTDAYCLYDFWVDVKYSGKGIYQNMLKTMIADIGSGYKSVIYAKSDKKASIKAIKRVGFEYCNKISFVRNKVIV